MEADSLAHALGLTFQVSFLDLILSGDNALVIALACRALPAPLRARAVLLGTGFAIALRLLLTALTGVLLLVPCLKLIGALLLIVIAIKLLLGEDGQDEAARLAQKAGGSRQLWSAVSLIVSADLALSLDNVLALAAAAQGSVLFLLLGLLLSVPLLMYGSLLLGRLMDDYPLLIPAGAAILGWLAGTLAVSDPLWNDWVASQAPALQVVAPLLCAIFVLGESRVIRQQRAALPEPPPLALFESLTGRLTRLGEVALQTTPTNLASTPQADSPAGLPEPPAHPQPSARAQAGPSAQADDLDAQTENLLLKALIVLAVIVGVCAIGWLLFHLLSQGLLPAPSHHITEHH